MALWRLPFNFGDHASQPNIASEVYSEDGVLLANIFNENRIPVHYSEISPLLIKTLVVTEDERFYKHFGIDVYGSFSALVDAFRGDPRGASTITQQLVKNLYRTRGKNKNGLLGKIPFCRVVIIKLKEMLNAFKLELIFDKNDIVTLYLNTVDFGNNAFGIKTAAKTYFNTTPQQLKPEQCALLVGLLKATTTYNPVVNRRRSRDRRNIVLYQMKMHGIISSSEYDSLRKAPLGLRLHFEKVNDGKPFISDRPLLKTLNHG
jgi:penicillin-binding protein 1A